METTTPWPQNIFAVTLFVEDLEACKRFYQTVFELPVVFEDANSSVFKIGTTLINLLQVSQAAELVEASNVGRRENGVRQVFTVQVNDVDALCAQLLAKGATLLNGPMDRPWGPRTASFADPAGHIWEIAC